MGAGFGGAIKNVGMGLGSRAGKLDMHAGTHPVVTEACIGCGQCFITKNNNNINLSGANATSISTESPLKSSPII